MSTNKPIKVAGKELKPVDDVIAIDTNIVLHEDERRKHLVRGSSITSDISPVDISKVTGMPEEHSTSRRARIYKEAKNAMQSGTKNMHTWKLGTISFLILSMFSFISHISFTVLFCI